MIKLKHMLFYITLLLLIGSHDPVPEEVSLDLAEGNHRLRWTVHPVWGEPSFDSFHHMSGNPVLRGIPPYEWPVNGFLFEDPLTGYWYLYVGNYTTGYELNATHPSHCTVFESRDKGISWQAKGRILPSGDHMFENETSPVCHAPDVSVVYFKGLYHLCFDWTTENTTWENASVPDRDSNSGVGYAWATTPEGPFQPTRYPIASTREQTLIHGKYRRLYASSLIRRAQDWLVPTLTDSGPFYGWALLAMTAKEPEGPYSKPQLVLYPESNSYHPPLLEFFPAFVHDEFVYMPATSVALNRNFQCLFRAPIEEAHNSKAWQLYHHGSLWHSMPMEWETYGIWGQTFSGFVDRQGLFHVMFPSRDSLGRGTINLAVRSWDEPLRERGFIVSGHQGPSVIRTRSSYIPNHLNVQGQLQGVIGVLWNMQGPMGANVPRSDASLHKLTQHCLSMLEITASGWRLISNQGDETGNAIASGHLDLVGGIFSIDLKWEGNQCVITIQDKIVWEGQLPAEEGGIGLWVGSRSWLEIQKFCVQGHLAQRPLPLLYTEALVGAAQGFVNWEKREIPLFRYGEGAVSKIWNETVMAKWNFWGTGFRLWAPKKPYFGRAQVYLDGAFLSDLDFTSNQEEISSILLEKTGLSDTGHALILKPHKDNVIPVDSLDILSEM